MQGVIDLRTFSLVRGRGFDLHTTGVISYIKNTGASVRPPHARHATMTNLDEPLLVAQRLRGGCQPPATEDAEHVEDPYPAADHDLTALCERQYALSLEALANPTELGTASRVFSRVLRAVSSRPLCGAIVPLWLLALVGPNARGPGGLLSTAPSILLAWFERLAAAGAVVALPLQLWLVALEASWPATYGSCLRAILTAGHSAADSDPSTSSDVALPGSLPKKAAGACVLDVAGHAAAPLACLSLLVAIALYVRDATRLDCAADDANQDDNKSSSYPWACTWASAAWLATRLVDAVLLPDLAVLAAMFLAHCQALATAAVEVDSAELGRLLDEANAIWARPTMGVLVASAALGFLGLVSLLVPGAVFADAERAAVALSVAGLLAALPGACTLRVNAALRGRAFVHACLGGACRLRRCCHRTVTT